MRIAAAAVLLVSLAGQQGSYAFVTMPSTAATGGHNGALKSTVEAKDALFGTYDVVPSRPSQF